MRLGAPLETWTYQEIRDNIGEITDYLPMPTGKVFKPDDDTAVPLVLLRALENYGPAVTAEQIGETLLNYLGDGRGTLWWGGYGVSTEHTAYLNLLNGIAAPRSGSAELNGKWLSEQIGGQIFSDIWGLVAPNNPHLAADYAARQSSVTHDGEGINGGRFIAGLVSLAFGELDPRALVEGALALIDPASTYAAVVRSVIDFFASEPDDWRACYHHLAAHYGYDKYTGVHIIPNAGVVVLGLLYGEGDFSRALQITTMCGWDTDCNVGNMGAVMGVAVGLAGIAAHWRAPMNDLLAAASLSGAHNLWRIPHCADRMARCGAQIAGAADERRTVCHFDFTGSTYGFGLRTLAGAAPDGSGANPVVDLRHDGRALAGVAGSLRLTLRGFGRKTEARAATPTYLHPAGLTSNYYGGSFSPQVYGGQTLTAQVYAPPGSPPDLLAALYAWDEHGACSYQGQGIALLPGQWTPLHFRLPPLYNVLLAEVGLVLRNTGEPWSGPVWLTAFDWGGPPAFSTDFGAERHEFGAISQWTFWRGFWRLEDGVYHGSSAQDSESYTGDDTWKDLALTARLTPVIGPQHRVNLRVQGARRSYAVGLADNNRLAIFKKAGAAYVEVISTPFAWEHGRSYTLRASAQGSRIAASVENGPQVAYEDGASPYLHGRIGFSIAGGSHCAYSWLEVTGL